MHKDAAALPNQNTDVVLCRKLEQIKSRLQLCFHLRVGFTVGVERDFYQQVPGDYGGPAHEEDGLCQGRRRVNDAVGERADPISSLTNLLAQKFPLILPSLISSFLSSCAALPLQRSHSLCMMQCAASPSPPGSEISAIWKWSTFLEPHTRCVGTQGTGVQQEYSWPDVVISCVICDCRFQEEQFAAPVKNDRASEVRHAVLLTRRHKLLGAEPLWTFTLLLLSESVFFTLG